MAGYRSNVEALCDTLGVPNPIQAESLRIDTLIFCRKGAKMPRVIELTGMNRAGFLFFQSFAEGAHGVRALELECTGAWKAHAAEFFAENWIDREEKERRMLIAFADADSVKIGWK